MPDEKPKLDPISFLIVRGGLFGFFLIALLSIPVGFIAVHVIHWPLAIAYLLGVAITDGMFLFLMVLPFVLIFLAVMFFPNQGTAFFEFLGKLYGLGLASFMFFLFMVGIPTMFIGLPLMAAINSVFAITLPMWSMLPLGVIPVALYIYIRKQVAPSD